MVAPRLSGMVNVPATVLNRDAGGCGAGAVPPGPSMESSQAVAYEAAALSRSRNACCRRRRTCPAGGCDGADPSHRRSSRFAGPELSQITDVGSGVYCNYRVDWRALRDLIVRELDPRFEPRLG
jgi:hypothetical protein